MLLEFPWILILLVPLAAVAVLFVLRLRKASAVLPPSQAIVMLLREPEPIEARQLASAFSRAAGCPVAVAGPIPQRSKLSDPLPPGDWIAGALPSFLAKVGRLQVIVVMYEAKYISDPDAPPWSISDKAVRDAVAAHTAWLSVEIVVPETVVEADYRIPARVVASLLGENCLALYFQPQSRFALRSEGTSYALRSDTPIQAVFGPPGDSLTTPRPSR
ncbi:MAG: hypothetical protein ABI972_29965, partial [Acidobacteriota bacterium]